MGESQEVDDVRHVTCTLCEAMCSLEVRLDGDGAIASMRGHEAEVMRLLGEIEALVNEVQA